MSEHVMRRNNGATHNLENRIKTLEKDVEDLKKITKTLLEEIKNINENLSDLRHPYEK
jgi:chaperonin cofactor prefoldin